MWALLFTLGCVANLAYCLYLMISKRTPGPILEPRDAAQPGPERGDGADVDWKLLSLRCRRRKTGTLGRDRRLASVHLSVHRHGQSLGIMARRVAGRACPGRRLLNQGLLVLIVAVITVAISNFYSTDRNFHRGLCDRARQLCENRPAHVVRLPIPVDPQPRARWMRFDTAQILKRFFFCERSLLVSQAAWIPAVAPLDIKTGLARFIWQSAETADALRNRVFELRFPSRLLEEEGADRALIELFGAVKILRRFQLSC